MTGVCRLCLLNERDLLCVFDSFREINNTIIKDIILTLTGIVISKEDTIYQKICTKCGRDLIKLYEFRERCLTSDKLLKDLRQKSCQRELHPSVTKLFNQYPGIKLPHESLHLNFAPMVEMELNEVENYFKRNGININKHIQQVKRTENNQKCFTNFKETVSPISIKFRQDKSGYEIVHKPAYNYSDGKLQKEIINLINSSSSTSRKRKLSVTTINDSKKIILESNINSTSPPETKSLEKVAFSPATIISNIILKPAVSSNEQINIDRNRFHSINLNNSTKITPVVSDNISLHNNILAIDNKNNLPGITPLNPIHTSIENNEIEYIGSYKHLNPINTSIENNEIEYVGSYKHLNPIHTSIENNEIEYVGTYKQLITCKSKVLAPKNNLSNNPVTKIKNSELKTVSCEFCTENFESDLVLSKHLNICNSPTVVQEKLKNNIFLKKHYDQASVNIQKPSITPNIEILNSSFSDIDFEVDTIKLIQQLLISNKNNDSTERDTQTELPFNKFPSPKSIKSPMQLQNFKPFLDLHNIPVVIKNGEKLTVKFNLENSSEPTAPAKLEDWSKLTPIDVKIVKKPSIKSTVLPEKNTETKKTDLIAENTNLHDLKDVDDDLLPLIDTETIQKLLDSVSTRSGNVPETVPTINMPQETENFHPKENSTNNLPYLNVNYRLDSIRKKHNVPSSEINNNIQTPFNSTMCNNIPETIPNMNMPQEKDIFHSKENSTNNLPYLNLNYRLDSTRKNYNVSSSEINNNFLTPCNSHNLNFQPYAVNKDGSANYLPQSFTDESHKNRSCQNFINVNVNVFNKPPLQDSSYKTKIWYPPPSYDSSVINNNTVRDKTCWQPLGNQWNVNLEKNILPKPPDHNFVLQNQPIDNRGTYFVSNSQVVQRNYTDFNSISSTTQPKVHSNYFYCTQNANYKTKIGVNDTKPHSVLHKYLDNGCNLNTSSSIRVRPISELK